MTEDMRERGAQSKWNELFVVETDRGEWVDMAGEGGWSAFSLLSEAQEIADSEDEPCKIVRFVRQAAISSAATSGMADRCGNCDHHSDLHDERGCTVRIQKEDGKRYSWMVDCPCGWNKNQATSLRGDSLSGKGDQ